MSLESMELSILLHRQLGYRQRLFAPLERWCVMTPTQRQMLVNMTTYAQYLRLDLSGLWMERVSVAYETVDPVSGLTDTMTELILQGNTRNLERSLLANFDGPLANPHPGFDRNYRQTVASWSMQVCIGEFKASFDVDRCNPNHGLLPMFGHIGECVWDKLKRTDTDQRKVMKALKRMGLEIVNCIDANSELEIDLEDKDEL